MIRPPELNNLDPATLRLTDCQFASVVTDDKLKFELPTVSDPPTDRQDGTGRTVPSERGSVAGTTALLVSETESAVQFGRDLFESLRAESDPVGPYVQRQFPELGERRSPRSCVGSDAAHPVRLGICDGRRIRMGTSRDTGCRC